MSEVAYPLRVRTGKVVVIQSHSGPREPAGVAIGPTGIRVLSACDLVFGCAILSARPGGVPAGEAMWPFRRIATAILVLICFASLALTLFGAYHYYGYERGIVEPLKEDLIQRTRDAAARIETSLAPAREAAGMMARRLDAADDPREERLVDLLREAVGSDESCFGGAIAFEPYAFDSERRLYAPYVARKNGELTFQRIEESYDYTDPEQEWYGMALTEGPRWSEPYFDASVGDILMTTYSDLFHKMGESDEAPVPRGVVTIDVSMAVIRHIVRSLDLGGMGYAILLSREGKFLYHPDEELVLSGMAALEVTERAGDADLGRLVGTILEGGSGIADHTAPLTGLDSWFVYEPVPTTGWSLVGVFIQDDAPIDTAVLRQWQIAIGAALVVFLSTGGALVLNVFDGDRRRLWALSIVASVLLAAGIGFTWHVALAYDSDEDVAGRIVTDIAGLKSFEKTSLDRSREHLTEPPVFLSTGLLIDSLRFDGGTDVEVRGYIWQKYDSEIHAGLERGVSLGGVAALRTGEPEVEQAGGTEVVRWPFEVAQRVRFENSKYPLMRERFALRVVPRELARNIVLIPDLEAYPILSPTTRPGLDENVYLPGWEITRTFFELRERVPVTDFGLDGSASTERFPSLYFNIEVRKEFVDTFVSNLVPLIIVGVVIFLVLMILEREEDRIMLMRTGTGFNLSICATLLFVAVFSHIGARQKIAAQEIIYLEYFYVVMYFAILWVAVNSILFVRWPESKFIQYENNLLPKVLFWPVILGALWVLTLRTFY